jgi:serine-type D-Ala-D-Ala carboxypeptidase (penicillin-binding protein 5/6)
MKKYNQFTIFNLLLITTLIFGGANLGYAEGLGNVAPAAKPLAKKIEPISVPEAPKIDAKAYILIDAHSGKILAENNADKRRPPASLTKMMTLYVVSNAIKEGRIKLTDKVRISKKAWRTGGSKMFVRIGQLVSVHNLIRGIIVDSGNDACVALAEYVAGTENSFADLMNQQAKALGMNSSHFTDSTGLPHPNHYVTARDLAVLARALIRHFPEDYKWYKEKWFTFNGIKQPNRNRLLWRDRYVDGIKTGHTQAAGYCLVTSAKKKSMRLIGVVMGAPSDEMRAEDSQRLLTYGFRFFQTEKLYDAGQVLKKTRIWEGKRKYLNVGLMDTLYITFPRGLYNQLKAKLIIKPELDAPIKAGQVVGQLKITLNNEVIADKPVVALQANPRGNIIRRFSDYFSWRFHRWFSSNTDKAQ